MEVLSSRPDDVKVVLSAVSSILPGLTTILASAKRFATQVITVVSDYAISPILHHLSNIEVSPPHLYIVIAIGVAIFVSALAWLIRIAYRPRHWRAKRPWSPVYHRKSSYSSRCLREAISSKAPFAETLRRETVIYKMGSAFSARQRRDMF
eukprot:Protomagalhaensia_sp_Gyna_25__4356@NODE_398_length_3569_cov_496_579603_g290_i1_p5_GENE_NODE_398_length_3569_cov_496_579603_g290_i1NODE_398_length_3569_cov_496_579603_g290_i1_p5_ORF_typecomplete_len151_score9_47DUF2561/PF10812_8/0_031Herpes_gE/PF02480_16/0_057Cadherin_C_2/PF16492_5/9_1e03Cadherin_C_2/PF16492_5/0_16Mid2/PF04478_12/0_2FtsX/PF02687_21/0_56_NODE_398_length_3569_cov_496_579603_g290_i130113463